MIGSIALLLLGAAAAPAPCESLTTMALTNATITSAAVVPEGPPPPRGGGARGGGGAGGRGGGARGGGGAPAAPPANIPAHCKVVLVLRPTSDSLINMEMWLPTQNWNGKFMGVGNGGFAGSIQGRTNGKG